MKEYFEKSLQRIKQLPRMTEKEWNRIAYKENLLSSESMKYISGMSIEELQKRLGKLTVSNFLESCINMYDASMMLGLEIFSYFFWNVISVNESTYVNNYQVLKNIVGDDGRKLYADIISTVMNM